MAMWLCGYVAMRISSKNSGFQRIKKLGAHMSIFSNLLSLRFPEIIFFQDVPRLFLDFLRCFGIIKWRNTGLQGLENQEIMKNQILMSNMMKSGLY